MGERFPGDVDFEHLFKLRLVVARMGEMDNACWWNSKSQLGCVGAAVLKRGFPRTHRFVQARSVFAVAAQRCAEIFAPPECATLWALPAEIEDAFDEHWQIWLDRFDEWEPFFSKVAALEGTTDLLAALQGCDLVTTDTLDATRHLKRSAEGRGVLLPSIFQPTRSVFTLLAAGFSRGDPGEPAVPYARLG